MELRQLLLESGEPVVTSVLARIELASALRAAGAASRVRGWQEVLAQIDADFGNGGPLTLLALRPEPVLATALRLTLAYRLRTLDALHVAVALEECPTLAGNGAVVFVTRDRDQAAAAAAAGLAVG